jgi:hypothetical protein
MTMQTAKRIIAGLAALIALSIAAQTPPASALNPTPAKGPLRIHPTNPRYFTDGTRNHDGSLKAREFKAPVAGDAALYLQRAK